MSLNPEVAVIAMSHCVNDRRLHQYSADAEDDNSLYYYPNPVNRRPKMKLHYKHGSDHCICIYSHLKKLLFDAVTDVMTPEFPTAVVEVKTGLRRALEKGELGEEVTVSPRGVGVTSVLTLVKGRCINPSPLTPRDTDCCRRGRLGRPNFPMGAADMRLTFDITRFVCMNFPPERLFMADIPLLLFTL